MFVVGDSMGRGKTAIKLGRQSNLMTFISYKNANTYEILRHGVVKGGVTPIKSHHHYTRVLEKKYPSVCATTQRTSFLTFKMVY